MEHSFKARARECLDRARHELASGDLDRTRYAALELRMAIEHLVYDRAHAWRKEVPIETLRTWQPRKLLLMLIEVDPKIDMNITVKVAPREDGQPIDDGDWLSLGQQTVLSLTTIKKHYDALGSYLHAPTILQLEDGKSPAVEKLVKRCSALADSITKTLDSPISNIRIGQFTTLPECPRCNEPVRKRIPMNLEGSFRGDCINCGVIFEIEAEANDTYTWNPLQHLLTCSSNSCDDKFYAYQDELKIGSGWNCDTCGERSILMLSIFPEKRPQAE